MATADEIETSLPTSHLIEMLDSLPAGKGFQTAGYALREAVIRVREAERALKDAQTVLRLTKRAVSLDISYCTQATITQALEKVYNKPSKCEVI